MDNEWLVEEIMTDRDKFRKVLEELGIKYELTDDSYEYSIEEMEELEKKHNFIPDFTMTAIVIEREDDLRSVVFCFTRDGKFKEFLPFS